MRAVRAVALLAASLAVVACQSKKPETGAPAKTAAAPAPAGDKILVGHVGSMTGSEATFGQSTDNGIKLAIEQWNAKGGVKGKPISLRTYDNQGKPEEAAVAATRLIVNDKVNLLLGEVASSALARHGAGRRRERDAHDHPVVHQSQGHEGQGQGPPLRLPGLLHRPLPGHGDGQVRARRT